MLYPHEILNQEIDDASDEFKDLVNKELKNIEESFKCSFFSWMACNANLGTPVNGGTLIMMSLLLHRCISVYTFCKDIPLWKTNSEMIADVCLLYCGDNCFIEVQVGT